MQRSAQLLLLLILIQLVLSPKEMKAQARDSGTGEVYAAPGMMVKVRRPSISIVAKPATNPTVSSIILPRFWNQTDSTRKAEYAIFIRELYKQIKYPVSSLREQVEGVVYLNFRVTTDGQIDGITLKKSNLVWSGEATIAAKDALAAEAMRVAKTLRFAPSTSATDTVTVPVSYRIQ